MTEEITIQGKRRNPHRADDIVALRTSLATITVNGTKPLPNQARGLVCASGAVSCVTVMDNTFTLPSTHAITNIITMNGQCAYDNGSTVANVVVPLGLSASTAGVYVPIAFSADKSRVGFGATDLITSAPTPYNVVTVVASATSTFQPLSQSITSGTFDGKQNSDISTDAMLGVNSLGTMGPNGFVDRQCEYTRFSFESPNSTAPGAWKDGSWPAAGTYMVPRDTATWRVVVAGLDVGLPVAVTPTRISQQLLLIGYANAADFIAACSDRQDVFMSRSEFPTRIKGSCTVFPFRTDRTQGKEFTAYVRTLVMNSDGSLSTVVTTRHWYFQPTEADNGFRGDYKGRISHTFSFDMTVNGVFLGFELVADNWASDIKAGATTGFGWVAAGTVPSPGDLTFPGCSSFNIKIGSPKAQTRHATGIQLTPGYTVALRCLSWGLVPMRNEYTNIATMAPISAGCDAAYRDLQIAFETNEVGTYTTSETPVIDSQVVFSHPPADLVRLMMQTPREHPIPGAFGFPLLSGLLGPIMSVVGPIAKSFLGAALPSMAGILGDKIAGREVNNEQTAVVGDAFKTAVTAATDQALQAALSRINRRPQAEPSAASVRQIDEMRKRREPKPLAIEGPAAASKRKGPKPKAGGTSANLEATGIIASGSYPSSPAKASFDGITLSFSSGDTLSLVAHIDNDPFVDVLISFHVSSGTITWRPVATATGCAYANGVIVFHQTGDAAVGYRAWITLDQQPDITTKYTRVGRALVDHRLTIDWSSIHREWFARILGSHIYTLQTSGDNTRALDFQGDSLNATLYALATGIARADECYTGCVFNDRLVTDTATKYQYVAGSNHIPVGFPGPLPHILKIIDSSTIGDINRLTPQQVRAKLDGPAASSRMAKLFSPYQTVVTTQPPFIVGQLIS